MEAATGCTVVLCPAGAVAGVDVRGSAPGTRETDLLNPINTVQKVHAVLLAGGSAFGLAAADGVMRWLEEHGYGFDVGVAKVPIVPGAVIFDLVLGSPRVRPDSAAGYAACQTATTGPVAQGNIGAGTGATLGKVRGLNSAMKSGLGSVSRTLPGGVVVAALAVVNPWGQVSDPRSGRVVAGPRQAAGADFADTVQIMESFLGQTVASTVYPDAAGQNTTLGIVATNAALSKTAATKMAQMAHDGLARSIRPVHTQMDGDTIFALALGEKHADVNLLGAVAADVLAEAVVRGVEAAETLAGVPAVRDWPAAGRPPAGR